MHGNTSGFEVFIEKKINFPNNLQMLEYEQKKNDKFFTNHIFY